VKYNPDKHHRRSIRLPGYDYSSSGAYFITICTHQRQCLFGEIVDGAMQLNSLGQMVRSHWLKLPHHHAHVELDAWVIMPNHIHGILFLTNPCRGAALGQDPGQPSDDLIPDATPPSDRGHTNVDWLPAEPGVAFGQELIDKSGNHLPNAAPLPPRLGAGTVGAIVLNFKSITTRSFNRIRRSSGQSI
jgi:hypothetical protein